MNFESAKQGPPSAQDALQQLAAIEANIRVMGRNDTEFSMLTAIRHQLETGKISPADAIAQATDIVEQKQDYN